MSLSQTPTSQTPTSQTPASETPAARRRERRPRAAPQHVSRTSAGWLTQDQRDEPKGGPETRSPSERRVPAVASACELSGSAGWSGAP
jgi:hypothetical protein